MSREPRHKLRLIKSRYYTLSPGGRGKGEGEIRLNFHPHLNPPPQGGGDHFRCPASMRGNSLMDLLYMNKVDSLVKSRNMHNFVIPVKTGIQSFQVLSHIWIPAYARMTDFLRMHQS